MKIALFLFLLIKPLAGLQRAIVCFPHMDYDQMAARSDEEVVALMREQTERLYPQIKGSFLFSLVMRQDRVCYVPDPGFFDRTKRLWEAVGNEPHVHLAGDVFGFGSLEAAVATGERAAKRLINIP